MEIIAAIMSAAVRSGTPVLYATLGGIITERSGIMNLGTEGVMLMGAYAGFAISYSTGNPWLGIAGAFVAGMLMALIHAFLCINMGVNQVVSGLALAMFGTGLSSFSGRTLVGETINGVGKMPLPVLSDIPVIGPVLFFHDPMVYMSYLLTGLMWFYIYRTRGGLNLRAVGDNPRAADAMGLPVTRLRYLYVCLGGGMAAVGGAYMSVVYTQMWVDGMVSGRGWISVALVIFGLWNPARAALGAYLFGGVDALQLRIQAAGGTVPASLLLMLPYVMTIVVLTGIAMKKSKSIQPPASLGIPYRREERH